MTKEELEKEADDYADEHAFRVPYDGSNKFYDDVDFKASREGYLAGAKPREKRIKDLEEELKNWKDEWQEQVQKATDEGYARTQQTIQLTKAREIIKRLKSLIEDVCDINYLSKNNTKLLEETEQFLNSDVEK